jgi:hypothetical protein
MHLHNFNFRHNRFQIISKLFNFLISNNKKNIKHSLNKEPYRNCIIILPINKKKTKNDKKKI